MTTSKTQDRLILLGYGAVAVAYAILFVVKMRSLKK